MTAKPTLRKESEVSETSKLPTVQPDILVQVSFSWTCPYHGAHGKSEIIAGPVSKSDIISVITCHSGYPTDPVLTTTMYGNLKLVANKVAKS